MNDVTATPTVSRMRKRFTAYSAARASILVLEGWFALASLRQRLNNMGPLLGQVAVIPWAFRSRIRPACMLRAFASLLIAQGKAVRHLLRVGLIKGLAKLTAVNFRVFPDLGLHVLWIVVPALEVSRAKFPLGILLIAGALPGLAH